jgi:hypothetical protein
LIFSFFSSSFSSFKGIFGGDCALDIEVDEGDFPLPPIDEEDIERLGDEKVGSADNCKDGAAIEDDDDDIDKEDIPGIEDDNEDDDDDDIPIIDEFSNKLGNSGSSSFS